MADYIERKAAIRAVTGAKLPDIAPDGVPIANGKRSVGDCLRRIKNIPAADVRPVVRGEWIEHYEHYDTGEEQREAQYGYVCSVCGRWEYEKEPFCNCGADMATGAAINATDVSCGSTSCTCHIHGGDES